jgi:Cu/Ag efflux pump CusA
VEQNIGQPQLKIIVNRQECARYGITTDRVLDKVETAIG